MLYANNWELWQLYHKVTFDGINRTITINPNETQISVKADIYSAWKEWIKIERNTMFEPALRTIGGDTLGGGQYAGDIYFLMNGWQVIVNQLVSVSGALYNDVESLSSYVVNAGGGVISTVANLVQTISLASGTQTDEVALANAVWTRPQRELTSVPVVPPSAVDVSTAVWANLNRTLTVASGLTSEQEAKIDDIKTQTDKLKFDITGNIIAYIEDKTGYVLSDLDKNDIVERVWSKQI